MSLNTLLIRIFSATAYTYKGSIKIFSVLSYQVAFVFVSYLLRVSIFFSHKDYQISQPAAILHMQDAAPELKHHYKCRTKLLFYVAFVTVTLLDNE